jgi:serine/threonine-protein phosphatase 2A regulatory subunit A
MDPASASSDMLPLFLALAQDRQDSVRIHAVDNAVALAKLVPLEILNTQVLPTVFEIAKDGSWRVRWSIANRFPEICDVTNAELVNATMCDCLVALLQDSEAEVRTSATSKAAGVCKALQPQRIVEKIVPCFQTLARDLSDHVRSALASVVMKVAPFLGRELTIDHLLPLFLLVRKTLPANHESEIANDLFAMCHVAPERPELRSASERDLQPGRKQHCTFCHLPLDGDREEADPGSCCFQVIGIELLSQSLLPAIVHLAEDRQWRVRLAIIEYIPQLAAQLGQQYFEEQLSPLCMSWLADNVFSIRGELEHCI